MIHFATVHWKDDSWIPVQRRFIERNLDEPFKVWGWLNFIEADHSASFDYVNTLPVKPHKWKLNILGDLICQAAGSDDEIIIFIDGDAFPIRPLMPQLRERLEREPLVAVRRAENAGEPQPHPCFCATTVGFWRELGGDWRPGPKWDDPRGIRITDVGARVWRELEQRDQSWDALLRSNVRDLHPLMFGVYGDLVYHHGGAFRRMAGGRNWGTNVSAELGSHPLVRVFDRLPADRFSGLRKRYDPRRQAKQQIQAAIAEIGADVFELIQRDDDFDRLFLDPDYPGPLADARVPAAPSEVRGGR